MLPPLTKTQAYDHQEIKKEGEEEGQENGEPSMNASESVDAGHDNSMVALKKNFQGRKVAAEAGGAEAATVSAI